MIRTLRISRFSVPELLYNSDYPYDEVTEYLKTPGTPAPPYLNPEELNTDLNAFENIRQIRQIAQPIVDMLDDTMLLCGSEAYVAVLAYYTYLKGAAKMNVPGAKTILEDLSNRFPGRPAKKETVD